MTLVQSWPYLLHGGDKFIVVPHHSRLRRTARSYRCWRLSLLGRRKFMTAAIAKERVVIDLCATSGAESQSTIGDSQSEGILARRNKVEFRWVVDRPRNQPVLHHESRYRRMANFCTFDPERCRQALSHNRTVDLDADNRKIGGHELIPVCLRNADSVTGVRPVVGAIYPTCRIHALCLLGFQKV